MVPAKAAPDLTQKAAVHQTSVRTNRRTGDRQKGAPVYRCAVLLITLSALAAACASPTLERLLGRPVAGEPHEVIAARYRDQADDARELAAYYFALAARWRTSEEGDADTRQEMVEQYRALGHQYEQAAARYDALAANHEALAAGGRPLPPRERKEDRVY
jgi:hypothetical protein